MSVAATFWHLLDDAGPADQLADHDGLVGSRVVRDVDLGPAASGGMPLTLVVTGGAGQVAGPLARCASRGLALAAVHLTARDPGEPVGATRRLLAAVDEARAAGDLDDDVALRVGLPAERPGHGWLAAADEVAAAGAGLLVAPDGPSSMVVAWLDAALAREVPLSVAAAAHHAVRAGSRHGLLNLLLGVRMTLDGAAEDDLVWLLDQTDGEALADLLAETGDDAMARARRWLTAAACSDVDAVAAELRALGLVA